MGCVEKYGCKAWVQREPQLDVDPPFLNGWTSDLIPLSLKSFQFLQAVKSAPIVPSITLVNINSQPFIALVPSLLRLSLIRQRRF